MSDDPTEAKDKWARLRFSIVAPLLASPPEKGELRMELAKLARKRWRHPLTNQTVMFGVSTLERWYYRIRSAQDPISTLRHRIRKDAGEQPSLKLDLRQALRAQYRQHDDWSYRLHYENLVALAAEKPELGPVPSYPTVRRWMKSQGLFKKRRRRTRDTPGAAEARERLEQLEVRSFEVAHVGGLWHLDFHLCSRPVLTRSGHWVTPKLLGILDDASRLCCHAQWYLDETETLVHGLSQALQKRGLCRALLTDNGSAMLAAETAQGLEDLGIAHYTTLPHSPYQNAKQEAFWVPVESRLLPMLAGVRDLTLDLLNEATQAWYEFDHNREIHAELGKKTPLSRFLEGPSVARECPPSEDLRRAFRMKALRTQRRSDGTLTVEGVRFEVPNRFRHLERLTVRYARWNLASVDLVDAREGKILAALYPIDKAKNADAQRRRLEPLSTDPEPPPAPGGIAPLLKKLMADYAATGLPPAYLPKEEKR